MRAAVSSGLFGVDKQLSAIQPEDTQIHFQKHFSQFLRILDDEPHFEEP
jgi:hypothetical protein